MIGEWAYFKSYFSPEACQKILDDSENLPTQKATLGVEGSLVDNTYRKSNVKFLLKNDPNFFWLYDTVWKMAIQANSEWFDFHISKVDYIQLAEYSDEYKGEYKRHHDVFWINNDPKYHRKLTCVIQLTDPSAYEGGDLELYDIAQNTPDKIEIRQQGTAIFFPSFVSHAALPVTKGKRHSLAIWFDGPKWR